MGRRQGGPGRTGARGRVSQWIPTSNAAAGPFSSQPFGPWPVGCFSALLAPYVSIQDTPVARALKNSRLTCGETYAYLGDKTLGSPMQRKRHNFKFFSAEKVCLGGTRIRIKSLAHGLVNQDTAWTTSDSCRSDGRPEDFSRIS
jgi:hypothetical protein